MSGVCMYVCMASLGLYVYSLQEGSLSQVVLDITRLRITLLRFPSFVLGMCLSLYKESLNRVLQVVMAIFSGCIIYFSVYGYIHTMLYYFFVPCLVPMLIALLKFVERRTDAVTRVFSWIGTRSLQFYLFHALIIYLLRTNQILDSAWVMICICILGTLISVFCFDYLKNLLWNQFNK